MDRVSLPTAAANSIRTENLGANDLLALIGKDNPDATVWRYLLADVAVSFRRIAGALEHQAASVPSLTDERSRWMYRLAEQAVREHPREPSKVEDQRTRCAMLAENLGDRLADYALSKPERERKWARERAERDATRAQDDGQAPAGAF